MLDRDGNFIGFIAPQYTQVPDELFDELLATLSGPETKVLLYLIRRTFGFKRDSDAISLNQMLRGLKARDGRQLDRGVGLSKPTIVKALKSLEQNSIILTRRARQPDGAYASNTYALNVIKDGKPSLLPQESSFTPHSQDAFPSLGKPMTPQETVLDKTDEYRALQHPHHADPAVVSLLSTSTDLLTALRELGVKTNVATELVRKHETIHMARMIEFVVYKVKSGWRPKESVAAWVVSAIREGWETPTYFTTAAEVDRLAVNTSTQEHHRANDQHRAQAAEETRIHRAHQQLLIRLGVDGQTQRDWEKTQELLRERGQWTIALADAHLVRRKDQLQVVVGFDFAKERIERIRRDIEAALSDVLATKVEAEVVCDAEAFQREDSDE